MRDRSASSISSGIGCSGRHAAARHGGRWTFDACGIAVLLVIASLLPPPENPANHGSMDGVYEETDDDVIRKTHAISASCEIDGVADASSGGTAGHALLVLGAVTRRGAARLRAAADAGHPTRAPPGATRAAFSAVSTPPRYVPGLRKRSASESSRRRLGLRAASPRGPPFPL